MYEAVCVAESVGICNKEVTFHVSFVSRCGSCFLIELLLPLLLLPEGNRMHRLTVSPVASGCKLPISPPPEKTKTKLFPHVIKDKSDDVKQESLTGNAPCMSNSKL